jgi:hypothetical protein
MLEEFIWKALDLLDKLDELGEILTNPDLPDDLGGAQHVLEEHNHLKRRVTLAPVEQLSMEGHHILTKITGEYPGQSGKRKENKNAFLVFHEFHLLFPHDGINNYAVKSLFFPDHSQYWM